MNYDADILKSEEKVIFELRSLYHRFGYAQYKMSKFEEYELYVNNKDFLISSDVITFTDTNGRLMALKPDVTLSIVRSAKLGPDDLQKVYYDENVYRIPKGARGFREIRQVGLECLGAVDSYCLGEVLQLACESLRIISAESMLNISHLGLVGELLDGLGLAGEARRAALRCIGEKNLHELSAICLAQGAPEAALERLCRLLRCSGAPETVLPELESIGCGAELLLQLRTLCALLEEGGCAGRFCLDFSVLNDMSYYNGIAFQGFVRGVPTRVISGGQYDRLLTRMGKKGSAVGFACTLDLLERLDRSEPPLDADTVLLYDEGADPARVADAVRTLAGDGSVLALRSLPEKLRFRRIARLGESGVSFLA